MPAIKSACITRWRSHTKRLHNASRPVTCSESPLSCCCVGIGHVTRLALVWISLATACRFLLPAAASAYCASVLPVQLPSNFATLGRMAVAGSACHTYTHTVAVGTLVCVETRVRLPHLHSRIQRASGPPAGPESHRFIGLSRSRSTRIANWKKSYRELAFISLSLQSPGDSVCDCVQCHSRLW